MEWLGSIRGAIEYMEGHLLTVEDTDEGLDVISGTEKVIDIAYKYGYDTPESFTKAFTRFHGITPTGLRNDAGKIKVFLPLKITIQIQGGNDMDYTVEKMKGFQVIGYEREISFDTSY